MFLTSFGVYYFTSNGAKSTEKKEQFPTLYLFDIASTGFILDILQTAIKEEMKMTIKTPNSNVNIDCGVNKMNDTSKKKKLDIF